jgi:hypothetical protein
MRTLARVRPAEERQHIGSIQNLPETDEFEDVDMLTSACCAH